MLNFLKKLFAKEEISEEKIGLNELNNWLDGKTKPLFEGLNNDIHKIINKINNEKEKVTKNLKTLENAKLQNPKIPERVKTIMEGNRAAFIKKVAFFFDNLDLKYHRNLTSVDHSSESQISRMPKIDNSIFTHNNDKDYNELIEKCNKIKNEIDSLGKGTARSYQVLNEFFAREAENIAINIKKIENYSKGIKNLINSSKISNIKKIKNAVSDIQNKIRLKEKYSIELENNKKDFQNNKNKKTEIEKKINELKLGNDYQNYKGLLEEKNNIELKINNIENTLFHDFSALEKALKKYAKIAFENEKLILEYLGNPIITLIKDADFIILKILDNLKNAIERNEFDLDEKKRGKALAKINELDGVYFAKINDDFKNAKQRLNDIEYKIKNSEANKELESNNKELKIINENIESLNGDISTLNNELEKINIEKLKEDLQEEIDNVISTKIILI